jgi:hypothetical protein
MATTITDYMESEPTAASRCGACCKILRKVLSFLLSHIGLLSLVVGYVIMGKVVCVKALPNRSVCRNAYDVK